MLIGEAEKHLSIFFRRSAPLRHGTWQQGLPLIQAIANPLHRQHLDLAPLPISANNAV